MKRMAFALNVSKYRNTYIVSQHVPIITNTINNLKLKYCFGTMEAHKLRSDCFPFLFNSCGFYKPPTVINLVLIQWLFLFPSVMFMQSWTQPMKGGGIHHPCQPTTFKGSTTVKGNSALFFFFSPHLQFLLRGRGNLIYSLGNNSLDITA